MERTYYVTTPIYYISGNPHIGHAYTTIVADVLARMARTFCPTFFLTGTDEHGQKVANAAAAAGKSPQQWCDDLVPRWKALFTAYHVEYDDFIRTTEPRHMEKVTRVFERLRETGDIYLGKYEGWYCVDDETFWLESKLVAGRCPMCGREVTWISEEDWFFRLSAYRDRLVEYFERNPNWVQPKSVYNEMMAFLREGLDDLSVSRTSFDWGVKVPGAEDHVMYVWVDALTNYLTGLGYPDDTEDFRKFWPADVHLIGKDIVRFHAVYWPAFLMSAGLPLPRTVFGHGFLLNRGQKESKSLGNVTDPHELADRFGVDVLRYFLCREISFGQDGSYSAEAIVMRANSELANAFGNLAQRTLSLIVKNCDGALPAITGHDAADAALFETIDAAVRDEIPAAFNALALHQGVEAWLQAVFACNAYIDAQAPWALKKTDPERMRTVLATLYIAIAQLAVAIAPVIPGSAGKLLDQMGIAPELRDYATIGSHWYSPLAESGFRLAPPVPLFPRLELPEEVAS